MFSRFRVFIASLSIMTNFSFFTNSREAFLWACMMVEMFIRAAFSWEDSVCIGRGFMCSRARCIWPRILISILCSLISGNVMSRRYLDTASFRLASLIFMIFIRIQSI